MSNGCDLQVGITQHVIRYWTWIRTHRANCTYMRFNRLIKSQIGRVYIFILILTDMSGRLQSFFFSFFHSFSSTFIKKYCKSLNALMRFATAMWDVVVKSLDQPFFYHCSMCWFAGSVSLRAHVRTVSISIAHAWQTICRGRVKWKII